MQLYRSVESQLSSSQTLNSETNRLEFSDQTIQLFESTKQNAIKICEEFNLLLILNLINNLSLLQTNQL